MPPNRIAELATIIHNDTLKVDAYLTSEKLPTPSFDVSCPARLPLPPHIQTAQEAILEATDELTVLMQGPIRSIAGQAVRRPVNLLLTIHTNMTAAQCLDKRASDPEIRHCDVVPSH